MSLIAVFIAFLPVTLCVIVLYYAGRAAHRRLQGKSIVRTYSCHHARTREDGVPYRDVMVNKAEDCGYTVRYMFEGTMVPKCPIHHCNLTQEFDYVDG
jgi:hypothetical protein